MKGHAVKLFACLAVGPATFFLAMAQPAAAANLYDLGTFVDAGKVVNTGTASTWVGFTFEIPTGYQATFDKVGIWVQNASAPSVSASIALYRITGNSRTQILQGSLIKGTNCTVDDGLGRNDFCWRTLGQQQTLSSGLYGMVSEFSDFLNSNTYYASTLASNIELLGTAQGVVWGNPYSSTNGTNFNTTPSDAYGYFGPNLGGFSVSSTASSESIPAPLPIIGGTVALAWSRQIRRRIKAKK